MEKQLKVNLIRDTRRFSSNVQTFELKGKKKINKTFAKSLTLSQLDQAIRMIKEGRI